MVLQRYKAIQELGKGSFGMVYLTEGRRDRKLYVVKVYFLKYEQEPQ
jgi:serine/threonine protein kinase